MWVYWAQHGPAKVKVRGKVRDAVCTFSALKQTGNYVSSPRCNNNLTLILSSSNTPARQSIPIMATFQPVQTGLRTSPPSNPTPR